MKIRGCKRVESRARLRHNHRLQFTVHSLQFAVCSLQFTVCSLQFAVCSSQSQSQYTGAVCKSQVTQIDAVTSQTLTLRGNKCLNFVEVWKGLYTKSYDYFPSDSKHVRDNLLNFPTSSCLRRTHPGWRATAIWSATNQDLRSRWRVNF